MSADRMADERVVPEEVADSQETADPFLAVGRRHGQPDAAFLDVHHAVAGITLAEDHRSWSITDDGEGGCRRLQQDAHVHGRAIVLGLHRSPPEVKWSVSTRRRLRTKSVTPPAAHS
jgi:hypothetical protein